MPKIPLVNLARENETIKHEINKSLLKVIWKSDFIMGEELTKFEKEYAKFSQSKYCVATSSGTTALHLSLLSKGIKPGDEVITVPNTFIATTETITQTGAKIKFVDVDYNNALIDIEQLKENISKKTKAIIPVHLYGQMCDMMAILEIASDYKADVIEDACQAHGSKKLNYSPGFYGDPTVYSFFPAKNLGCFGDGGALTTDDYDVYKKAKMLSNHGRLKKYVHTIEGYNYRMDNIQAAVLNIKLQYLEKWNNIRRQLAKYYNDHLNCVSPIDTNAESSYYMYVIRSKKRDELKKFLFENGIHAGIHYPVPLHLQPAYKYLRYAKGDFPNAEKLSNKILSIPLFPTLHRSEQDYIVKKIKEFENV